MTYNPVCSVCVRSSERGITISKDEHTNTFYAELLDVSEASVRRHYKHGSEVRLGEKDDTSQPYGLDPAPKEVVEISSNGARSVSGYAAVRDRPVTMEDARAWLRSSGDNPDEFSVSIRSIAYGADLFSNKMSAWPKPTKKIDTLINDADILSDFDPSDLLVKLRSEPLPPLSYDDDGDGVFVLSINDTQIGKSEGGGTPATLERFSRYITLAEERIEELRVIGRPLGTLVILGIGDLIEGCTIYPNQSYNLDLDRRGQIETSVSLILELIDRLAPLFGRVVVLAARGNHGENRINGNRTTLYDNDDTLVFEMAKLATDRDPKLKHVEYVIADSEAGVYLDIAGWRLAITHGDIYGKGVPGATISKKAQNWLKNMALGRDPLGQADVLITAHYHHDELIDWGATLWRQAPAQDGGSEYFRQTTGESSEPGMLTFVMLPGARYQDEAVLR